MPLYQERYAAYWDRATASVMTETTDEPWAAFEEAARGAGLSCRTLLRETPEAPRARVGSTAAGEGPLFLTAFSLDGGALASLPGSIATP